MTRISYMHVLGVRVHLAPLGKVLEIMDSWIHENCSGRYIVATGMHGIMESLRSEEFCKVLGEASLLVPDGYSLVKIARMKGFKIQGRVSGPDLMWEACKHAQETGHKMFFYGDTEETLELLCAKLKNHFPKLNIVGSYSPPFRPLTELEDLEEINIINASGADIIWVGLGLPKQEQWMFNHRFSLNTPVAIGVGAAFKFHSGRVRRAPKWVGENGFEWLWRLVFEPKRVWKRVFVDGPIFVFYVAREYLDEISSKNTK